MLDTETRRAIAQTILQQLGGRGFILMTGAKNFSFGEADLTFHLPIGKAGACRIALTPADTYTVTFYKREQLRTICKNGGPSTLSVHEDIYFDGLVDVFERATGLVTRVPKVRGL